MKKSRANATLAGCLLGALLVTGSSLPRARAEQPSEGKMTRAEAERAFRAGEAAYQQGRYLTAAEAFEKAFAQMKHPAIAFSAAQAYRRQYFSENPRDPYKLQRAHHFYKYYIEQVPTGGRSADALEFIAELEPLLKAAIESGALTVPKAEQKRTRLMVTATADGARGRINGGEVTALPLDLDVEPGKHVVEVRADGYFPVKRDYQVVDGQFRVVELEMSPKPALVRVRARPGSIIQVDGRPAGSAPLVRPLELTAGKHFVSITRRGHRTWSREVVVERGEAIELHANQPKTRQRKLSYAVFAAAGVSGAASMTIALLAAGENKQARDLERERNESGITAAQLDDLLGHKRKRDELRDIAGSLMGLGFALAGGGALLYYLDNPRSEAPPISTQPRESDERFRPVSIAPTIGPGWAGLALEGRF